MNGQQPLRVLLIEDNREDAELLQTLVQAENDWVDLQWVDRLASALERMRTDTFDIVVTDLQLPDSTGVATFEKIHAQFPLQAVVVLSQLDDQDIAIDAVRKGAQDYLIKGQAKGQSILRMLKYSIERQIVLNECESHLREIRTLRGLIPVCAWCRKVHSHKGYWEKVEKFIEQQTEASFSHGICPECLARTEPEIYSLLEKESPELLVSQAVAFPQARETRLLLIEDSPADAALVGEFAAEISDFPLDIKHADSLRAAVKLLQKQSFDIVLSDLGLPDSQGLETFIKIHTLIPDIPIVILTGIRDKELAATAVRSGAQDYIVKNEIDSALLRKSIHYAIERHKMLKDLRKNLREVRILQRERENLLSGFAHDIKNVIVPAAMLLSRIISGKSSPTVNNILPLREALQKAENMLSEFIEFPRFEGRDYQPAKKPLDLWTEILNQIEILRSKADAKNITIGCKLLITPPPVLPADRVMLQRVLANLLDNAVKYTPEGGAVGVTVNKIGSNILVQVQDSGIGISRDYIPYLFDAFYRAPGADMGSGLGLSIAKKIITAHGGEIWVNSTIGQGSSFNFNLPLEEAAPPGVAFPPEKFV